ncbi:hypothetical protein [Streptomyces sp. NPDC051572]|uniref:hypothetical protein n=1 Tax=Streptomyces sp. NPDC051572 TaxID=3155802 RepID=UPI00344DFEEB
MSGLRPKITEKESVGPDKFTLECPVCGEVGRYRFVLLARRGFEEHADEEHSVVDSPLDQIRTRVDLAETSPETWECTLGAENYVVRRHHSGRYAVEVTSRGIVIEAQLITLDDARIAIGVHAKVVNSALATAATIQLRHPIPADRVALD